MGRIEYLATAAVLYPPRGHRVASFSNLCRAIHFFQPFPMLSSPSSPCRHRESCPTSETPYPRRGPRGTRRRQAAGSCTCLRRGAAATAGPPAAGPPTSGRTTGALSRWETGCPGSPARQRWLKADGHTSCWGTVSQVSSGSHSPATYAQVDKNWDPRDFYGDKILPVSCLALAGIWEKQAAPELAGCIGNAYRSSGRRMAVFLQGPWTETPKSIKTKKWWYNPSVLWKPLQPAFTVHTGSGCNKALLLTPTGEGLPMCRLWPSASLPFLEGLFSYCLIRLHATCLHFLYDEWVTLAIQKKGN